MGQARLKRRAYPATGARRGAGAAERSGGGAGVTGGGGRGLF